MNKNILRSLSYGMYAVGVKGDERPNACIANSVIQVTSSPVIVAVSLHRDNYTNSCIKKTGEFTVSVLSENTSGAVIGALGFTSGQHNDKLENIRHKILREGTPVIKEECCCWFFCRVRDTVETPTHTIFIAEVTDGSEKLVGTPMTYEFYQRAIKGKTPKNAAVYIEEKPLPEDKCICEICNYEYDGILIPFEELPDDWICPICGAPKSVFKKHKINT